ncbi:RING-H2 finger protein ATL70-like [Curcuma longa]|uniref:RING-H2 finger protein ATL70-like n=1 Tax=Curcuma longa TaxID=136217 RepID=UPI003D9DBE62
MNSTDAAAAAALGPAAGTLSTYGGDGIRYALGVSVSVLLVIVTITVAFRYCTRAGAGGSSQQATADVEEVEAAGLDEATLMSYPKAVYSRGGAASSCSICLSDFKEGEVLRALTECGHSFHLQCVDPWLRSRPTCPLCRTSPLPSPMPTPLAEAIPLARQP